MRGSLLSKSSAALTRLALVAVLALAGGTAGAAESAARTARPDLSRPQPVKTFRPSQVGLGRDLVRYLERRWTLKAKLRGETLRSFVEGKAARTEVPVVVTPSGQLMALDRHHHITALRELADRTGIEVALPIRVVKDYRGYSQSEFAEHFVNRLQLGYFPPGLDNLSALEKMKLLPTSFDQMQNDPVRSAIGIAFRELDIHYIPMENYAELKLGQVAVERGLNQRARQLAASSAATRDPIRQPLVRAAHDLLLHDPEVRHTVKHLGLKRRDRHHIAKKLRKAS